MKTITKSDSGMSLEDVEASIAGLNKLKETMNFLVSLTPNERNTYSPRTVGRGLLLLEDRLNAAQQHSDLLPASFDLRQFKRDAELTGALRECQKLITELHQKVDDTFLVVATRSVEACNLAYGYLKLAPTPVTKGARRNSRRGRAGMSPDIGNPPPASSGESGAVATARSAPGNAGNAATPEAPKQ